MSYIGKEPQYTDFLSKFFSGDGTAMTVTLDASPPNEAALLVFIDGVRQDTSAYTVSGYSLTFTGAVPSGTNNVQVVHLGIAQDTQVPVDDSVSTAKIQDDAVTSAKLANSLNITSGNSLTIDSGATITNNGTNGGGFGKVLQVVQGTYAIQTSTTGTTYVTSNLSASITPSSTSNKVLVLVHINSFYATGSPAGAHLALYRSGSPIVDVADSIYSQANHIQAAGVITHLDSPSSTSSLSYEVYFKKTTGSTAFVHDSNRQSNIILLEIAG